MTLLLISTIFFCYNCAGYATLWTGEFNTTSELQQLWARTTNAEAKCEIPKFTPHIFQKYVGTNKILRFYYNEIPIFAGFYVTGRNKLCTIIGRIKLHKPYEPSHSLTTSNRALEKFSSMFLLQAPNMSARTFLISEQSLFSVGLWMQDISHFRAN